MKYITYLAFAFTNIVTVTAIAAPPGPPPSIDPTQEIQTKNGPVTATKGVKFYSIDDLPTGIREEESRRHQEYKAKGYVDSSEEEVSWLEAMPKAVKPFADYKEKVQVKLANLDGTPFSALKFLGVVREGPPHSLSRLFSFPNGTLLLLREWDYVAEGGGMLIPKDRVNEQVNGVPAVLGIGQSAKGKAMSELTWATDAKSYSLIMSGHVENAGMHKKMMALANSIKD